MIRPPIKAVLESLQTETNSPYLNPSDHPAERLKEQEPFICGYCNINEVEEKDDVCKDCLTALQEIN